MQPSHSSVGDDIFVEIFIVAVYIDLVTLTLANELIWLHSFCSKRLFEVKMLDIHNFCNLYSYYVYSSQRILRMTLDYFSAFWDHDWIGPQLVPKETYGLVQVGRI